MKIKNILELRNITKEFPGVVALDDINFSVTEGEIHAVVGENGAGKSTLIKIITGAHKQTKGEVYYLGERIENQDPLSALNSGIATIYQEFNLIPTLSVVDNIFFGDELTKGFFRDRKKMNRRCGELFEELEIKINVNTIIRSLSVAYQQIVEIAKALNKEPKLLIMDEPTAPLTENETQILFKIVKKLKEKGVSIVYISHRLEEVFQIADRITVFRDGKVINTVATDQTNKDALIAMMIGRPLGKDYPPKAKTVGELVLEVDNICNKFVHGVSFQLHKGEILGIAGLIGAGRTELIRAIYGADPKRSGSVKYKGQQVSIRQPHKAKQVGIGLLPEERKAQGVLLKKTIKYNISLPSMDMLSKGIFISKRELDKISRGAKEDLNIKCRSLEQHTDNLSGGNQQKVVIAKWLVANSEVLFFDEPTRGIDVGSKMEIYVLMRKLVNEGKAIIMISSELPELIGMSDRILVMHEGNAVELIEDHAEMTQENILRLEANY